MTTDSPESTGSTPAEELLLGLMPDQWDWLCLDLFDTLVSRIVHPEDVKRLACERLARIAAPSLGGAALYARRAAREQGLRAANAAAGHDPEFALPALLEALWLDLPPAERPPRERFVALATALEVSLECAVQRLEPATRALLARAAGAGRRCSLVSDFYMPGDHVRQMLAHHGVEAAFTHVVVSADALRTKQAGRLYDTLLTRLEAAPERVLMVGDNLESDVRQARAHGLHAHHLDRSARHARYRAWQAACGSKAHLEATLEALLEAPGDEPFPELALTLHTFTERLYEALLRDGVRDVFFLAREGQLLQRLFDAYQARRAPTPALRIRSHYLAVSRRATFLPALGPLASETFPSLFRQYRRLSGRTFLASLGLEALADPLAAALGADPDREEADWPTSKAFAALRAHPLFVEAYERERGTRQDALVAYLRRFPRQAASDTLAVVDVGWKGTIQDHLAAALAQRPEAGLRRLSGYYLGLVARGAEGPANRKHGVLFDRTAGDSPWAPLFDENRSLFEVLLAADHGPAHHYALDAAGEGAPVLDPFEEAGLYEAHVRPLQARLVARFEALDEALMRLCHPAARLLAATARHHGRMVLAPRPAEVAFFTGLWHREHFGVFEASRFGTAPAAGTWPARLSFVAGLLRASRRGELGAWPWLTCRQRGGPLAAGLYRRYRLWQAGRSGP